MIDERGALVVHHYSMDSSSRRDWAELSEAVLELIFRRVCTVSTTQADKSYDKIVHVPALPLASFL